MSKEVSLITIKQAATMLGVTPLTLRNWDKSGKLKALRHPINNYRVYKLADIQTILDRMSTNTQPLNRTYTKSRKKLQVLHLDN